MATEREFGPEDQTFRQRNPTRRKQLEHTAVEGCLTNSEEVLSGIRRLTRVGLHATQMPYEIDESKKPYWEFMRYESSAGHSLEAHVDRHATTIIPITIPRDGGELVIATHGKVEGPEDIESDPNRIAIDHIAGWAFVFTGGLALPHYVRPHIGTREVLAANVPVQDDNSTIDSTLLMHRMRGIA